MHAISDFSARGKTDSLYRNQPGAGQGQAWCRGNGGNSRLAQFIYPVSRAANRGLQGGCRKLGISGTGRVLDAISNCLVTSQKYGGGCLPFRNQRTVRWVVDRREPSLLPFAKLFPDTFGRAKCCNRYTLQLHGYFGTDLVPVGQSDAPALIPKKGRYAGIRTELKVSKPRTCGDSSILIRNERRLLRKRFYILFVARGEDGQLRKIPIPVHYLYVLVAGAAIGALSLTGIASSYMRMLLKVSHYNELRTQKDELKNSYSRLEQVAKERDIQVASLGSLAGEVSSLYGLKSDPTLVTGSSDTIQDAQVSSSLDRLYALKDTALSGATATGISLGLTRNVTTADWLRANSAPNLWPVEGPVTGSFGERIDPFNGEGAFHSGVDISASYGQPVIAPADGMVVGADFMGGYGRAIVLDHGHGITTRYGHLANFAVVPGQYVRRGDTIGYIGLSGRSTGPHLHYEVRINDTPVNPYKYLRLTFAHVGGFAAGS